MEQFDHPHIIRLIGVCSELPVWIVMEFAPLGEVIAFVSRKRYSGSSEWFVFQESEVAPELQIISVSIFERVKLAPEEEGTPAFLKLWLQL